MESINEQIKMQEKFNLQIKLVELEKEKLEIEAKILNVKRILYGSSLPEPKKGRSNKKDSSDNASGISGD